MGKKSFKNINLQIADSIITHANSEILRHESKLSNISPSKGLFNSKKEGAQSESTKKVGQLWSSLKE